MDSLYHRYFCYLFRNHKEFKNEEERLDVQYQNYLQHPLQPLMNNLSSGTYEVFENDVKKYDRYEHAIQAALVDYKKNGCFNRQIEFNGPLQEHDIDIYVDQLKQDSSMMLSNRPDYSNGVVETPVQVMVFGAGRGPLIIRAINASRN